MSGRGTKAKPPRQARKLRPFVGEPLPDTLGRRYAVESWVTSREPSGVMVAIADKDLMLSKDDVARHLNDKDVTIDVLRRRCEKLTAELANTKPHRQEPAAGSQYGGGSGSAQNGGDL